MHAPRGGLNVVGGTPVGPGTKAKGGPPIVDEPNEGVEATGLSRRTLLKRIGVGAGIVWSAPVLTSVFSRAAAQSAPPCSFNAAEGACNGQTVCGTQGCLCNVNADGVSTYCTVPTNCSNADCTTNADCPAGQVCQATCCETTKCFVVCTGDPPPAPAGGWKSAPSR